MENHDIYKLIAAADHAINREDFDSLMNFYSEDAILVVTPGRNVSGKKAIRQAFENIADYFGHSLEVSQGEMKILESGDTALVIANTIVKANQKSKSPYLVSRNATYVFKKNSHGKWLCAIDNSYGVEILHSN